MLYQPVTQSFDIALDMIENFLELKLLNLRAPIDKTQFFFRSQAKGYNYELHVLFWRTPILPHFREQKIMDHQNYQLYPKFCQIGHNLLNTCLWVLKLRIYNDFRVYRYFINILNSSQVGYGTFIGFFIKPFDISFTTRLY